ncbi:FIG00553817: hypothetical protein [Cronobacter condimenti 1330]|uniref:Uncharacterized protein n=1 Tax=Cronobacter condimenti 1330 TaxID=1073999 RepID=K8A273_9ENTR|nr:FIG00553817: hypothetical protein [Cronobacter condimenti 1330]
MGLPVKFSLHHALLLATAALPLSYACAGEAVRLDCVNRGNVLVSFFKYRLSTMKWENHFQISGIEKSKTESGVPYETISFRNGDDLIYFPEKERYVLFDAGKQKPERCQVEGEFTYPVVSLPRYDGKAAS